MTLSDDASGSFVKGSDGHLLVDRQKNPYLNILERMSMHILSNFKVSKPQTACGVRQHLRQGNWGL